MKTLCTTLALTVIVTALLAEVTDSFEGQHPVFPPGIKPPRPGDVGDPCITGFDCKNNTCCVQSSHNMTRTCQRLGLYGQQCTDSPIKGSIYQDHCPCMPDLRCREVIADIYMCVSRK
uniref:Putative ixodegrin protein n=1 Tax=Ixodes ricinus TaxID=34613 RepID=A0A0K8R622_IXORI